MGAAASEPLEPDKYPERISKDLAAQYTGEEFDESKFHHEIKMDQLPDQELISDLTFKIDKLVDEIAELEAMAITNKRTEAINKLKDQYGTMDDQRAETQHRLDTHDGCIPRLAFLREIGKREHEILKELYLSTNGEEWWRKKHWPFFNRIGYWEGVHVHDGVVVGLELNKNNLIGTLPDNLNLLRNLRAVRFEDNDLEGDVPYNFVRLAAQGWNILLPKGLYLPLSLGELRSNTYMTKLSLANCGAIGDVAIFEDLPHLTYCDLRANLLEGRVSTVLFDILLGCEHVDLSHNPSIDQSNLEGFLACNYERLYDLREVDGHGCGVGGTLESLAKLNELEVVCLGHNAFVGGVEALAHLEHLVHVELQGNELEGPLPMLLVWMRFDGLEVNLSGNRGFYLPDEVADLPDPCHINLSRLSLAGELPLALIYLKLRWWCHVDLNDNVGLELPKDLSSLVREANLYAGGKLMLKECSLVGDMAPLAALAELKEIDLSGNRFTGLVPEGTFRTLCRVKKYNLQWNRLEQNTISGHLAMHHTRLWDKRHLDLSSKGLRGDLPAEIIFNVVKEGGSIQLDGNQGFSLPADMSILVDELDTIRLDKFFLIGTMEPLAQLGSSLIHLSLRKNQLEGTLAPCAHLPLLQTLDLASNCLNGDLSPLEPLAELRELVLTDNRIEGSLDPLQTCCALQVLDVTRNRLTGGLEPLAAVPGLRKLRVPTNDLSGPCSPLNGLLRLEELEIYHNRLTGVLSEFKRHRQLKVLWLSDYDLPDTEGNHFGATKSDIRELETALPECFITVTPGQ